MAEVIYDVAIDQCGRGINRYLTALLAKNTFEVFGARRVIADPPTRQFDLVLQRL